MNRFRSQCGQRLTRLGNYNGNMPAAHVFFEVIITSNGYGSRSQVFRRALTARKQSNGEKVLRRSIDLGVDGIITNRPDRLMAIFGDK